MIERHWKEPRPAPRTDFRKKLMEEIIKLQQEALDARKQEEVEKEHAKYHSQWEKTSYWDKKWKRQAEYFEKESRKAWQEALKRADAKRKKLK